MLKLAYRIREKYPKCSIFWIPTTNSESLLQAYLEAGRQLGIPGLDQEQANIKKLVQRHLSQESAGQWLLILDNADDMDMWIQNGQSPGLIDYLPRSSQGCAVFTTRSRKIAVKLAQQNVIKVSEMDEEVAMQVLSKSLIDQGLLQNHEDIIRLLQKLTFLPLAIVQAAAYINENGTSLTNYLLLLEDQEQNIIELLSEEFEDEGRYRDTKNPVATTWLVSFEQIQRRDPLAANFLSFMSCIDPRDIPQSLLPPAASRKKETDAIGTLSAYSFVSQRSADQSLDLHRLVHLATRNWLRMEGRLSEWAAKAVARLNEMFPDNDHKNRSIWRAYLPHARYVLESCVIADEIGDKGGLLWKFGMCLHSDGRYSEAEKSFFQVVETRKRVLGAEHPDTLTSIGRLAWTLWDQGQWKEAENLEVQVMETSKRVLGAEHLDTLTTINNLASTFRNQGRWKEAEELDVQVIETRKRVLGAEHPGTLTSMNNLASTFWNQGRWKEAEELEVQVMETRKRVLGAEHPDTLTTMNNLAFTWKLQDWDKEAIALMKECVRLRERVLGLDHPLTSSSRVALNRWERENLELVSSDV